MTSRSDKEIAWLNGDAGDDLAAHAAEAIMRADLIMRQVTLCNCCCAVAGHMDGQRIIMAHFPHLDPRTTDMPDDFLAERLVSFARADYEVTGPITVHKTAHAGGFMWAVTTPSQREAG